MMIRTMIVDDEEHAIENLEILLKKYCPDVQVVDTSQNILDGIRKINMQKPHLVLLDVSMPSGSGFDLLDALVEVNFQFIFITAFEKYAIDALRRNALDYLIKPVDFTELQNAIEKVKQKLAANPQVNSLMGTHLFVPVTDGIEFINYEEIIYLEAEGNYVKIHTADNKPVVMSKTLKDLEYKLPSRIFIRCHRSYIVNRNKIKKYNKGDGSSLTLSNGAQIPLSSGKKDDFLGYL
ncbi:MAG: response regulator transcription factor [Saprospiraceae bacterium]|nr:response regulator transcription factor [Saprospiraceae bacterium]